MNKQLKEKWEEAYSNMNNFVFFPNEDIIRFISKNIRKKIGHKKFNIIDESITKGLDLGCGIGANVFLCANFGLDITGVDLSETAIEYAKNLAVEYNQNDLIERFVVGSATELPFEDNAFDFIISHGVLDSMALDISKKSFEEAHRVLRKGGLFYADLICADGVRYEDGFSGETIITDEHEKDTIQLYFNDELINEMIKDKFDIVEKMVEKREYSVQGLVHKRYYLTLRRK